MWVWNERPTDTAAQLRYIQAKSMLCDTTDLQENTDQQPETCGVGMLFQFETCKPVVSMLSGCTSTVPQCQ